MPLETVAFKVGKSRLQFDVNARCFGPFMGIFIEKEYDCSSALQQPPKRILDLGGNIGFGTAYFKQQFPDAAIAVIEPDPRNIPLLRRNLKANGIEATIIEGAIGAEAGSQPLCFGDDVACSSIVRTGVKSLPLSVMVSVMTVPQVMEQLGWDHVDLLKVDIEGSEEDLFARNNSWLKRVGAIILEVHPNTTPEKLNGYLSPFGFQLERLGAGHEPVYFTAKKASNRLEIAEVRA